MTAGLVARRIGAGVWALVLLAMAAPGHAAPQPPSADARAAVASARPAIEGADSDWFPAIQAGDAERLAEPYDPTAVFIAPDGSAHLGRAAIVELYRARSANRRKPIAGVIVPEGMAYGGDGLVFEWGHGRLTSLDDAGKAVTSGGAYLTAWRRDAEGRWKIIRNIAF